MHCEPGEEIRGEALIEKKDSLEPAVSEHGWILLWRCPEDGRYWESRYVGRYDESEYLICLEKHEFKERWSHRLPSQPNAV